MKVRAMLTIFTAYMALTSVSAFAHPGAHSSDEDKDIPTSCEQLANGKDYVTDVAYPEIKALQAKCESEKKPTGKAVGFKKKES
ncbi:MAG: hypothetical protein V4729_09000 [Pseudomonadota bacterium]